MNFYTFFADPCEQAVVSATVGGATTDGGTLTLVVDDLAKIVTVTASSDLSCGDFSFSDAYTGIHEDLVTKVSSDSTSIQYSFTNSNNVLDSPNSADLISGDPFQITVSLANYPSL